MITYGFSLQGKSHIRKGVVCQDSHIIEKLENGWCLLAVADGVGSAKYSEEGSRIATQTIAQYCMEHVVHDMAGTQLLTILKEAYALAFQQIAIYCQNRNGQIEDYDTTLSVAIYTGNEVYFGHAGDGGIIIKDSDGKYEMITMPQKGEDGISVRPLRAGDDSWEFGVVYKKVVAVLLATDGMLDTLMPPLLSIKQIQENPMMKDKQMNVYVTLAEFFLNPSCVFDNPNVQNPNQYIQNFLHEDLTNEQFNQCLYNGYRSSFDAETATAICNTIQQYNYCTWKIGKVDDDKTIACAINDNIKAFAKEPEYYAEPDWKTLQQQFDRLAYPSLYENSEDVSLENNDYAKLVLQKDCGPLSLHNENTGASHRLNSENHVSNHISVSPVGQAQVRATYQKNKKKGKIVNIVCVLAIVVVATIVAIVGIKVIRGLSDSDEELLAKATTQVLFENIEVDSEQESVSEDMTEVETSSELTTENVISVEDNLSTENDSEEVTSLEREPATENASSEEAKQVVVETEMVLGNTTYLFPCALETLKRDKILTKIADNKYTLVGNTNADIVIETDGDIEETLKSISMTLVNMSEETGNTEITQKSTLSINLCNESTIRLGMAEADFETRREDVEQKIRGKGIKEIVGSGWRYRIEYQRIIYIVYVEDALVKKLRLEVNGM